VHFARVIPQQTGETSMSANVQSMAFIGNRNDIWHRFGEQMAPGESVDDWRRRAGMDWNAIKVPAIAALEGEAFEHIGMDARFAPVPGFKFLARSDNGHVLGYVSDGYQIVQPSEVLEWFRDYISNDSRFELDVAGVLGAGERVWATAKFNGDLTVAGERHSARVLMVTSFDGSLATRNKMVVTRVVCQNTLAIGLGEKTPNITTRHSTRFVAERVGRELSKLAASTTRFKAIGDAMATVNMEANAMLAFFRATLDIAESENVKDLSTRKQNQLAALASAHDRSVSEGAERFTAWSALQAVTRYADHERSTRGGDSENAARFESANFGSGEQLKQKAMGLLMPLIKDKVPVAA
jgi:phage/plasmid-like protein (TIGR03299 family)